MSPLIYAHRGLHARAPENTRAAFDLALKEGTEGIELDLQLTKDGQLAVLHDLRLRSSRRKIAASR